MGIESVLVLPYSVRIAASLQLHPGKQQWYVPLLMRTSYEGARADRTPPQLPIK
jgi:hypothetical protein